MYTILPYLLAYMTSSFLLMSKPDNHVSGGGLDVIAMIRTLAIKVHGIIFTLHSNDVHAIDTKFWPAHSKIRIPPG